MCKSSMNSLGIPGAFVPNFTESIIKLLGLYHDIHKYLTNLADELNPHQANISPKPCSLDACWGSQVCSHIIVMDITFSIIIYLKIKCH